MAKHHRLVTVALYPIVVESQHIYYDTTELLTVLIDRFDDLEIPVCVRVHETFCRISKQYDELDAYYSWCKEAGVIRASECPEVEKITPKKLELMDEFIRGKASDARSKLPDSGEADLLHLGDDAPTSEDYGDKLALVLFDGAVGPAPVGPPPPPIWEVVQDNSDWETALVQSASYLSHQKASFGGSFDTLVLDGLYQQGAANAAMAANSVGGSGSASSVALGSVGNPHLLALPAPPPSSGIGSANVDPFAPSLGVPPPPYVQMSDLEEKQRLLVQEQLMWQQYQRNNMQGHHGLPNLPGRPPYMGGYGYGH